MSNILSKRYLFFALSLLIIVPGLVLAAIKLPLSIDFTGGSLLEVRFENNDAPQPAQVKQLYEELGIKDVVVQTSGTSTIIARSSELADGLHKDIEAAMEQRFSDPTFQPALSVSRSDIAMPVQVSAPVTYTLSYNNQDARDVNGVYINDAVIMSLKDVKIIGLPVGSTVDEAKGNITLGKLAAGANGTLIVRGIAAQAFTQAPETPAIAARKLTEMRFESVGATVGKEVAGRAAWAVVIAASLVVVYISLAFRGLDHSLRYGICAIIAMVHDIAIVISLGAIGGQLFGWQVDALFLTALLTVIGFSIQDKVVVFDRIRENSVNLKRLPFETLVNHSIVQTLQRSINTQLMTVEFMLLALALFGGVTLREFAVILLVGLFSGTYSSIFIAASVLVVWEKREWRQWFKRGDKAAAA